ncbi:MAG TPA: hypothetical protein VD788_12060 [Candidatus Polarisedimenticolaceae bacterium]|nr:hypothetical protein [Candidatus Polarisedimenticolaceae bacterium]
MTHNLRSRLIFFVAIAIAGAGPAGAAAPADGKVVLEADRGGRPAAPDADRVIRLQRALEPIFGATRVSSTEAVVATAGTIRLVVDERHAVFSIARIDGEGRLTTECVTGAAEAASRMDEADDGAVSQE